MLPGGYLSKHNKIFNEMDNNYYNILCGQNSYCMQHKNVKTSTSGGLLFILFINEEELRIVSSVNLTI